MELPVVILVALVVRESNEDGANPVTISNGVIAAALTSSLLKPTPRPV